MGLIRLFLALAGLYVSGVLTIGHLFGGLIPCGAAAGCEAVAAHPASRVGGIPIALIGFLAYFVIAALAVVGSRNRSVHLFSTTSFILSATGALVSMWLTIFSIKVIDATCAWCLASAAIITAIFFTHLWPAPLPVGADPSAKAPKLWLRPTYLAGLLTPALVAALGYHYVLIQRVAGQLDYNAAALAQTPLPELLPEDARIKGDPSAPIVLIKFTDLMCPACRQMHVEVRDIPERFPGIRMVIRHSPLEGLPGHELAPAAAAISEIAGETGRFWEFLDAIFSTPSRPDGEALLDLAEQVGLDRNVVAKRVEDGEDPAVRKVRRDMELGNRLGLHTTPIFIVIAEGLPPRVASPKMLPDILNSQPYKSLLGGRR
jgi:protein-disulfide isomerase/uncharacterized membrane protein